MLRTRVFWKIYLCFIAFILLTSVVVGLFVITRIENDELEQTRERLTMYARLLRDIDPAELENTSSELRRQVQELHDKLGIRLTLIKADGTVVIDSDEDAAKMDNHASRVEVVEALQNGIGTSTRYSNTVRDKMMYVALPIKVNENVVGFSRTAIYLTSVEERTAHLRNIGLLGISLGVVVALLLGLFLARQMVSPLSRMTALADSIAGGNYQERLPVNRSDEFGDLARALNTMAAKISADIAEREAAEAALEKRVSERTAELTHINSLLTEQIAERQRTEAVLQASEERYRVLVENANDIIFTIDLEGNFTSINKAGENLTGYILKPWEKLSFFTVIAPEYHNLAEQMMWQKLSKKRGRTTYEIEVVTIEQKRLALEVNSQLIFQDGKPAGIQGIARDVTERKWAENQMRHNALHDALTGLPNRALFLNHLEISIERRKRRRSASRFAVLFLDIDRFKVINDGLGHLVGDKLLVEVADRLKNCLRADDVVARFGGDEFTVLLSEINSLDYVEEIAERILAEISRPFAIEEHEIFTSTSIGIALSEDVYKKPEELLRDADTAMYRAKNAGKARYQIFDQTMHVRAANLLKTETSLRRALEREEFEIHYQPIVRLRDRRITGFESLLRWRHPERGLIPPAEFIPLAEENGFIIPIGQWVLRESCRQIKHWHEEIEGAENICISVNLSVKQLARHGLIKNVSHILNETKIEPRCLNLEITESAIMENSEAAKKLLRRLKDLGVWLTTDDFGTGYSSLSYLHRFPIDCLKIDRSFVWGMTSQNHNLEIVKTILTLAQTLNMDVVAEGVENEAQIEPLKRFGCEYAQGYLFSKPLVAADAEKLLKKHFQVKSAQEAVVAV
jgi:diguanylate cyclase (GGDEF)-like protein/PAS domain S-box-containing protein